MGDASRVQRRNAVASSLPALPSIPQLVHSQKARKGTQPRKPESEAAKVNLYGWSLTGDKSPPTLTLIDAHIHNGSSRQSIGCLDSERMVSVCVAQVDVVRIRQRVVGGAPQPRVS